MRNPWLNNNIYYDKNCEGWYAYNSKTRTIIRINRKVGQSFMTTDEIKIENDYDELVEGIEYWDYTASGIAAILQTAYAMGIEDRLNGIVRNEKYGEIARYESGKKSTQAFYNGGYDGIKAKDVIADRPLYYQLPWFTKEQIEYFAVSPFHIWGNILPEKPKKTSKMALAEAELLYSKEYIKEHYEKSLVK